MLQWLEPRYLVKIVSTYTLFCTERQPSDLCIHMKKKTNHFPSCQRSHYLDCIHTFCYLKLPQNNIRISRTPNLSLTQEFGVVNENTLLISQTQPKKASFFTYQRSFHHLTVMRLPNHWWAISWAITMATLSLLIAELSEGSYIRLVSLYVIKPQCSVAPLL